MTYTTQEEFIDEIISKYLVYVKELCGEHSDCLRKDRFERFIELETKKTIIKSHIDFKNIEPDIYTDILWIYYTMEYIQLYDRYHPKLPTRFHTWVLCKYGYNDVIKFQLQSKDFNLLIHYINEKQYNVLNMWYDDASVCLK